MIATTCSRAGQGSLAADLIDNRTSPASVCFFAPAVVLRNILLGIWSFSSAAVVVVT